MQDNQLEIRRSGVSPFSRVPLWVNFATVVCAVGLLVAVSLWTVAQSQKSLRESVSSKLETILEIEAEAVGEWMNSQKQLARVVAADHELVQMLESVGGKPAKDLPTIESKLEQIAKSLGNPTCLLITVDGNIIFNGDQKWLVEKLVAVKDSFCQTLMAKDAAASPILTQMIDSQHQQFATVIAAPIRTNENGIVGYLGIGRNLTKSLTEVLSSSRSGDSGESLAVAEDGALISKSRFGDSTQSKFPFEKTASKKVNLVGKPDHRGVKSVMASQWLPSHGLGLVVKMDHAEANAPINRVVYFMRTLFGLLLLTASSTLFYRWYVMRLRQHARQAELSSKRLGAYELEEKIGEGGMGVVYAARHALLRRPTAVKILPPEKSNFESIARFEREVQFTSKLKHPNTISIYDYGRTENGLFYYAMELLEGLNLEQLVEREGPLPDGRVIEILSQSCQSLREAHALGLVHRDVKPANIILCNRGGAYDTVKVLDFGMVRDRSDIDDSFGFGDSLSGTPLYMAPECFTEPDLVDERADIFALGAVAFFVLTGTPLFDVTSLNELLDCQDFGAHFWARQQFKQLFAEQNLAFSEDLAQIVYDCLAPVEDRIASVSEVINRLSACQPTVHWGRSCAEQWWSSIRIGDPEFSNRQETTSDRSRDLEKTQNFIPMPRQSSTNGN